MKMQLQDIVVNEYARCFDSSPEKLIFAPGRINLIGEHTDYSEGFVLPVAINLGIMIALSPTSDERLKIYSTDFDQYLEIDLRTFEKGQSNWSEYIKGVAWILIDSGFNLKGFRGVLTGNLPIGAGLSSSAALQLAAAKALCVVNNITLSNTELAVLSKRAECEWVGVNVGIMDQLISAEGKRGFAIKLDCRSLEKEYVKIPQSIAFVVLDTKTRRELSSSLYNQRHEEVKQAASILCVPKLRDATLQLLDNKHDQLSQQLFNRAKHVIEENKRVHAFGEAMKENKLEKMGDLLKQSHKSLRDKFEVSSNALNTIVNIANDQPGCYGARMTGAGFGGCALAMVDMKMIESFIKEVHFSYKNLTGIDPHIFCIESANGVGEVDK